MNLKPDDLVRAQCDDCVTGVRRGDIGKIIHSHDSTPTVLWERPSANGNPRYSTALDGNLLWVMRPFGLPEMFTIPLRQ